MFSVPIMLAQNTVQGRIFGEIEGGDKTPIFNATVFLKKASVGDQTDDKGNFKISGKFEFPDTLFIRASGYYEDTLVLKRIKI